MTPKAEAVAVTAALLAATVACAVAGSKPLTAFAATLTTVTVIIAAAGWRKGRRNP